MRKKMLCALVFAVGSNWLGVADAAYVIKLKNGNEFITSRYWQDGKQVLFETYDGIFGVDKAFVSKVEKSDKPVRLITTAAAQAELTPVESNDKDSGEAKKNPAENQEKVQAKRDENDPIFRHFQSIKERNPDGAECRGEAKENASRRTHDGRKYKYSSVGCGIQIKRSVTRCDDAEQTLCHPKGHRQPQSTTQNRQEKTLC